MKITTNQGRFFENDKIIKIKTDGEEPFTFRDLFLVVNLASLNEINRCKEKYSYNILESGNPLFFEEAIKDSINLAKKGIDLTLEENNEELKKFCHKNKINFEQMKQTRLEDFLE